MKKFPDELKRFIEPEGSEATEEGAPDAPVTSDAVAAGE